MAIESTGTSRQKFSTVPAGIAPAGTNASRETSQRTAASEVAAESQGQRLAEVAGRSSSFLPSTGRGGPDLGGGVGVRATTYVASAPRGSVSGSVLGSLGAADRQRLQDVTSGKSGAQAQANLNELLNSAGYKRLGASVQASALQAFVNGPPSSNKATDQLRAVLNNNAFLNMAPNDQRRALDIFRNTTEGGRTQLNNLFTRQVNGRSAMLDRDSEGVALLHRLHDMATGSGDVAPQLTQSGSSRAGLLASMMQEMAQPGQINQSNRGTCTVTSMQYMLNQANPAEYARLMQGLISPGGSVKLQNGHTVQRVPDSIRPDSATNRSATERLFQSAMMDYANKGDRYSNDTDRNQGPLWITYGGLYPNQEERALEALMGRGYRQFSDNRLNLTDGPTDIVNELQKRNGQRTLIDMAWGDRNEGGHAVVFEKVENGRVFFRNPWGPQTDANGTTYQNPPRRMEDRSIGLESMSIEDFKKVIWRAYLPE